MKTTISARRPLPVRSRCTVSIARIACLVASFALVVAAGCAAARPHTASKKIPFDELACTARDGTATCAFVDAGVACCAVQADGTEGAWKCPTDVVGKSHWSGVPEAIPGLVGAVDVAPAGAHLCALMIDGTVRCLGLDDQGALARGTYSAMDAVTAIGLWAPTSKGTGVIRAGKDDDRLCAIMGDGAVHCTRAAGALRGPSCDPVARGDGLYATCEDLEPASFCRSSPVALRIPDLDGVAAIHDDCAILRDGSVRCWGDNREAQIRSPRSYGIPVPTTVPGLRDVRQIDGDCAVIATSDKLSCFRRRGEAFGADAAARGAEQALLDQLHDVDELRTDPQGGCARTRGHVRCWGTNRYGELGTAPPDQDTAHPPTIVRGLDGAVQLASGGTFRCALADGRVLCWGRNEDGQLGDGTRESRATPREVSGLTGAKRIAVSGGYACAIAGDDSVWCWGLIPNQHAESPRVVPALRPERIDGFGRVARLRGGTEMCAVTLDTRVVCWGISFGAPERVTGTPIARAAFAFSDSDLLPARHVTPDRLICDARSIFCVDDTYCYRNEDECLDARARSSIKTHCFEQPIETFIREDAKTGAPVGQCSCQGPKCTLPGDTMACPPVDPATDEPIAFDARITACDARLRSRAPAPRSKNRKRWCAHWVSLDLIQCDCMPPPGASTCGCPKVKTPTFECFDSAAACESARSKSAEPQSSATDRACTLVEP